MNKPSRREFIQSLFRLGVTGGVVGWAWKKATLNCSNLLGRCRTCPKEKDCSLTNLAKKIKDHF